MLSLLKKILKRKEKNMTTEQAIEKYQEIRSLRHNMHVCRDMGRYMYLTEQLHDELLNIASGNIPKIKSLSEFVLCNDDCEEEDCRECEKAEEDEFYNTKESNNQLIEEWMREEEERLDLEEGTIAPTGMARLRWMESV